MKITPLLCHYVTAHNDQGGINGRYNKYYMYFAFFPWMTFLIKKKYVEAIEMSLSWEAGKNWYFRYRMAVTFEREILKRNYNHIKLIIKAHILISQLQKYVLRFPSRQFNILYSHNLIWHTVLPV